MQALIATLCQTRDRHPLVTIEDMPSGGADMTPAQLRLLAAALLRVAEDAEAQPMAVKHYARKRREYTLAMNPA